MTKEKVTKESEVICKASKSLLYNNEEIYVKKRATYFDVTKGTKKVCELINIFMLSLIYSECTPNNTKLYSFWKYNGSAIRKITKTFEKILKTKGLDMNATLK